MDSSSRGLKKKESLKEEGKRRSKNAEAVRCRKRDEYTEFWPTLACIAGNSGLGLVLQEKNTLGPAR